MIHRLRTDESGWAMMTAIGLMAIVLFSSMGEPQWWLAAPWQQKLPAILGLVALGGATYAGCLLAFGFRPRHFSRRGAG